MVKIKNKTKFIRAIAVILVLIVLLVIATNIINKVIYVNKYKNYSVNIQKLGLDSLYSGGEANDYKCVTNGEAIAIIVKGCLNVENVENYGYEITPKSKYGAYLDYAIFKGFVSELMFEKEDLDKPLTRINLLRMLGDLKTKVFEKELTATDKKITVSKAYKLQERDKNFLKDAIANNVFDNSGSISDTEKVRRGEFNKAIYEMTISCSTIVNDSGEIETNKENMPSNSLEYPFILKNREKSVYEKPFINSNLDEFESPNELFRYLKNSNKKIMDRVENYINYILNVDYRSINSDDIRQLASDNFLYLRDEKIIDEYVTYVKEHKIKLQGDVTTYLPAVYYDGLSYRIRLVLNFKKVEGDTLDNILLGDVLGESITYNESNNIIVDYPLENKAATNDLYPFFASIKSNTID